MKLRCWHFQEDKKNKKQGWAKNWKIVQQEWYVKYILWTCSLDIYFSCKIIQMFIKVCAAFVFGLQTLWLIDFSKIYGLKDREHINKGHTFMNVVIWWKSIVSMTQSCCTIFKIFSPLCEVSSLRTTTWRIPFFMFVPRLWF